MDSATQPSAPPPPDSTPSIIEIWTLYAIGSLMIAARLFVRVKLVGFSNLHPDDFLVCLAWLVYTAVMVMAHLFIAVAQGKHTTSLTPEMRAAMPPSEYPAWEFGSKIFVAGMLCYVGVIWLLKFNMLFFYRRLVNGLWVERFIKPAFIFVSATAVGVVLVCTTSCIPYHGFWQVFPDPGPNCVPMSQVLFYTILVLNLMSDLCILLIPVPVIAFMRASKTRKLGLYFLLSLGVFCMVCAIVRIVLLFSLKREGDGAMWSIREDFVSVFVGQAPIAFPLLKKQFWQGVYGLSFNDTENGPSGKGDTTGSEAHQLSNVSNSRKPKDPYSLTQLGITRAESPESQREMLKDSQGDGSKATSEQGKPTDKKKPAFLQDTTSQAHYSASHSDDELPKTPRTAGGAVTVTQTFEITDATQQSFDCGKHWKKPWEGSVTTGTVANPV